MKLRSQSRHGMTASVRARSCGPREGVASPCGLRSSLRQCGRSLRDWVERPEAKASGYLDAGSLRVNETEVSVETWDDRKCSGSFLRTSRGSRFALWASLKPTAVR